MNLSDLNALMNLSTLGDTAYKGASHKYAKSVCNHHFLPINFGVDPGRVKKTEAGHKTPSSFNA